MRLFIFNNMLGLVRNILQIPERSGWRNASL